MMRIISLGGDCQPGFHARRMIQTPDLPFVFDWMETPIRSLIRLLDAGFADFFAPENLLWTDDNARWSVTDSHFGVTQPHYFKMGPPDPLQQVTQTFRSDARRFLKTLRGAEPVVFVRRWIEKDGEDRELAARAVYERLAVHKPRCIFLYLQPHDNHPPKFDGNFISAYNPSNEDSIDWIGFQDIYDRIYGEVMFLASSNIPAVLSQMVSTHQSLCHRRLIRPAHVEAGVGLDFGIGAGAAGAQ